jgi:hypothetical protein
MFCCLSPKSKGPSKSKDKKKKPEQPKEEKKRKKEVIEKKEPEYNIDDVMKNLGNMNNSDL